MDLDKIAQAFAAGFTVGRAMAMDAARDGEEDGHWVTIGEGEEARPVFIKGAKKKAAKAESKKAESKKAESKPAQHRTESKKAESKPAQHRTESKKAETKKEARQQAVAKKSRKTDLNDSSMEQYMARTKFESGTFAAEWMQKAPDGAKTFARLTENMSEDCQYLLKNVLTTVKYNPTVGPFKPNESEAFYSRGNKAVNFPEPYFKNTARNKYKTTWEIVIHELGHAVDNVAGAKASDSAGTAKDKSKWITKSTILKNAVESDTRALIAKLKNDVQQKFNDNVQEKDLMLKQYRRRNPEMGTPTAGQLVNFGVAETIRGWQNRTEGGWCGILSGTSDMISALTLNEIKDGGSHTTEYWMSRQFNITTEFMAHYFEACTNGDYKKAFVQVFPTATKVLEILIEKTANTIRQKETKK